MGDTAFRKIQFGVETTRGTAVAADTMLLGRSQPIKPDRKPQFIKDDIGLRSHANRTAIYQYMVDSMLSFPNDAPLYFQALPFLFSCGIKGSVTPTEQTPGQADWLWDFNPSLSGLNNPQAFTLEVGDDTQAYECEYTMFKRYRLSATIAADGGDSPVLGEANFFARQWTPTTFTGALSLPTATTMNAKRSSITRDTSWAGVGGTPVNSILRGWELEILTGVHPKPFGHATNLYFDTHGENLIAAILALTLEGGSAADLIWDAQQAETFNVVRVSTTAFAVISAVSGAM
jgi:hypothetical protein